MPRLEPVTGKHRISDYLSGGGCGGERIVPIATLPTRSFRDWTLSDILNAFEGIGKTSDDITSLFITQVVVCPYYTLFLTHSEHIW